MFIIRLRGYQETIDIKAVYKILKSNLSITDKVVDLDKLGYPKYRIAAQLHISKARINIILEEELLRKLKKTEI